MIKVYEIKLPTDATLEEIAAVMSLMIMTVEVDTDPAVTLTAEAKLVKAHPRLVKDLSLEEEIMEAVVEAREKNLS